MKWHRYLYIVQHHEARSLRSITKAKTSICHSFLLFENAIESSELPVIIQKNGPSPTFLSNREPLTRHRRNFGSFFFRSAFLVQCALSGLSTTSNSTALNRLDVFRNPITTFTIQLNSKPPENSIKLYPTERGRTPPENNTVKMVAAILLLSSLALVSASPSIPRGVSPGR